MVLGDAGVYDGDVREWHWNLGEGQRLSVASFLFQILIYLVFTFENAFTWGFSVASLVALLLAPHPRYLLRSGLASLGTETRSLRSLGFIMSERYACVL